MKNLIISADDFGLTQSVNEGVELAHRQGLLAAASLMVSAPAAADAISRARAMPNLKVGLHLVLVEGQSALPHSDIPLLINEAGEFSRNQARLGFLYFFRPGVRDQLAREIRRQYELFAATGMSLDHLNAHKHMQLHPTVARLAMEIGRDFGLRSIRIPRVASPSGIGGRAMASWCSVLRMQARGQGLAVNDYVCGLTESGHFTEAAFLRCLDTLPDGVTEAYFHPAIISDPALKATMPDYDHPGELAALLSQRARETIAARNIRLTTYSALAA